MNGLPKELEVQRTSQIAQAAALQGVELTAENLRLAKAVWVVAYRLGNYKGRDQMARRVNDAVHEEINSFREPGWMEVQA